CRSAPSSEYCGDTVSDKPASRKRAAKSAVPTPRAVPKETLGRVAGGGHHDPHGVLGAHVDDGVVTVRALRPGASTVTLAVGETTTPMTHEHEGIWATAFAADTVPDYRLLVDFGDGFEHRQDDPYRYLPTLGEMDL